jgi:GDP-L-fucose synthase
MGQIQFQPCPGKVCRNSNNTGEYMLKDALIYIAGHTGLVGSALVRLLHEQGYDNLLLRTHAELDLTDQQKTLEFFLTHKPDYVFLAAAKVGGIIANSQNQADFIYQNLAIAVNIIHAAHRCGVKKLLNLGSACIYPKNAVQPIMETQLLTAPLESTNEGYAIAKIAAIKMCRYFNEQYGTNFMSVMPANLYGIHDNFDPNSSHVLPALIHKFDAAKRFRQPQVVLCGTGQPYREFLYADDCAQACIKLMKHRQAREVGEIVNIGYGSDIKIKVLAEMIAKIVGFTGEIVWDTTKPDGVYRRLLDTDRLQTLIEWQPKISLSEGIKKTYQWYRTQRE